MIGQVLALTAPERLSALALCSTGSEANEAMRANLELRIEAVRLKGMDSQVEPTLARWFSAVFVQSAPQTTAWIAELIRTTSPDGFIGCCRALQKLNLTERLKQIKVPTLLIPGENDQSFPTSVSEAMRERIDGSRLKILPGAAHLGIVEQAHGFNEVLLPFLTEHLLA
jgi:3-oxoadipate enol-lactonase